MNLIEFKKIKYWDDLVDLKKLQREHEENENNKKKYFTLKTQWKTSSFEFINLKSKIIW
jgi:hypothetical protein